MFVEGKVHDYTHDLKDSAQAQSVAAQVRMMLMGVESVGIDDPSMPPSDEVINAQARGEIDAPHSRRRFRDPAKAS